jgi:hypothetical protein
MSYRSRLILDSLDSTLTRSKSTKLETQFAGFNLGKIQDVINDRQQVDRAGPNGLGKLAVSWVEIAVEQQSRHANNTSTAGIQPEPTEHRIDIGSMPVSSVRTLG